MSRNKCKLGCLNIKTKCSENGIYKYCLDCGKQYEFGENTIKMNVKLNKEYDNFSLSNFEEISIKF